MGPARWFNMSKAMAIPTTAVYADFQPSGRTNIDGDQIARDSAARPRRLANGWKGL
jgi:hypothetical protein